MIIDMGYWTKVFKRLFVFLLTAFGIYLAFKLAVFYIPFLIAFIISLLIEPFIKFISRKFKITRKLSAILVLLLVFVLLIGILIIGIASIISESSNLLQGLNGYIEKIYEKAEQIIGNINFDNLKFSGTLSDVLNNSTQDFLEMLSNWVRNMLTGILQSITSLPTVRNIYWYYINLNLFYLY